MYDLSESASGGTNIDFADADALILKQFIRHGTVHITGTSELA